MVTHLEHHCYMWNGFESVYPGLKTRRRSPVESMQTFNTLRCCSMSPSNNEQLKTNNDLCLLPKDEFVLTLTAADHNHL
jgi:hypothetical protein